MVDRELKKNKQINIISYYINNDMLTKALFELINTVYINLTTPKIDWTFNMNDFTAMFF
jgi:hypothetical protein